MLNFDFNDVANKLANHEQLLAIVDDILAKHRIYVWESAYGNYKVKVGKEDEDFSHFIFAYKYAIDKLDEKLNAKSKPDTPNP